MDSSKTSIKDLNETISIHTPTQTDLKQNESAIRTVENETNSTNTEEFISNRKKKKRERSPTINENNNNINTNQSGTGLSNILAQTSISTSQSTQGTTTLNTNQTNIVTINQTTNINTNNNANIGKKEKQRPETWNKIEQQIFFNALRQNGKNFESITQYFNARHKRFKTDDGFNFQRSKEQIRHFYYRTWHKITKYVSMPLLKDMNSGQFNSNSTTTTNANNSCSLRDIQVKCLIAYNALMNKSHRWNKKTALKLVELINHGWTTVREKGKITRLRLPICKVSSKTLSKDDLDTNNPPLPTTISIQLEPKTESAYCRVHKLAQNPFLSIEVSSLQSIKYLIEFLESKWKNRRNQFIEKFQIDTKTKLNDHIDNTNNSSDNNGINLSSERLILYPNESHQISNLDLFEANSNQQIDDQQHQLDANLVANISGNNYVVANNSATNTVEIYCPQKTNNDKASNITGCENDQNEINNPIKIRIKLASSESEPSTPSGSNKAPKLISKQNIDVLAEDDLMAFDDCAILPDNLPQSTTLAKQGKKLAVSNSQNTPKMGLSKCCFQITADSLKAGITAQTCKMTSILLNKEANKDLTFIQLYLALNKPNVIKFKYDWVIGNMNNTTNSFNSSSTSQIPNIISITNSSSSSSSSSLFMLSSAQNQQQRFYIETLATVASSFLNDMQKSKHELSQNLLSSPSASAASKLNSGATNKSNTPNSQVSLTTVSYIRNKSPTIQPPPPPPQPPAITPVNSNSNNNSTSGQQIAFIQPSNPLATTVLPLETVLQKITEEQSNKTKKLLSDLSTKRRSRQRKIMVVNTGNPPRNMLPKLNIINGHQIIINSDLLSNQNNNVNKAQSVTILSPSITPNTSSNSLASLGNEAANQPQQQNIVYSRPVAVARQIVNNLPTPTTNQINTNSATSVNNSATTITNYLTPSFVQETSVQSPSSKMIIPSFHQAYSNLIPKILNTLTDSTGQNNQNFSNQPVSNVNSSTIDIQNTAKNNNNNNENNMNVGSPQTITDMSLLDISINNNDSLLFGSSTNLNTIANENADLIPVDGTATNSNLVGNSDHVNNGHMISKTSQNNTSLKEISLGLNGMFGSVVSNDSDTIPGFKFNPNEKMNDSFSQILNENSNSTLSNILNSLNCKTGQNQTSLGSILNGNSIDNGLSGLTAINYTNQASTSNHSGNNGNGNGSGTSYTLTHKRSDLIVEWTDSMNEVSLTGCFLNDLQSPEKGVTKNSTLVHVLNENSRDSLFFNVDTIGGLMDP